MRKTSKPAIESIEFVFGTTGHGYCLLTYRDGQTILDSHAWKSWGDVARTARCAWNDFAQDRAAELNAWSDEYGNIRASTRIDPADRLHILEQFIGCPEAASAQSLLEEVGSSSRAFKRLSQLSEAAGTPSLAIATALSDDDVIALIQRVLDEEGLGYIRLVRDDEFIRRVYSPSDSELAWQHALHVPPPRLH